jgi:hypothetical protein
MTEWQQFKDTCPDTNPFGPGPVGLSPEGWRQLEAAQRQAEAQHFETYVAKARQASFWRGALYAVASAAVLIAWAMSSGHLIILFR